MGDVATARQLLAGFLSTEELHSLRDDEVLLLVHVLDETLPDLADEQLVQQFDAYRTRLQRLLDQRQAQR